MDLRVVKAFEAEADRHLPGFTVRFKDESFWQRVIGLLLFFNKAYMTSFTTTLGRTVYFPSRAHYEAVPLRTLTTLAHEYVHAWDHNKHGFWFSLSYLLPQLFAAPLLAVGAVGLVFSSWFWASVVAGLLCLLPWPSPWRAKWESRGYTMNLAISKWSVGVITAEQRESVAENFYGPDYYYMVNGKQNARQLIDECAAYAHSSRISLEDPYLTVFLFLDKNGLARRS